MVEGSGKDEGWGRGAKTRLADLAVFGGQPAFAEPLHVGRPNVGDRQRLLARFNDLLDRRWFTNNGAYVREFESRVAELVGARHCIAVCNATIGLELAIRAAGLSGEVIVPSFTFVATPHALQWQEITPVFCDIDPATHNIDPTRVEPLITPRTTGIIGVHVWGRACDVRALTEIASRRKLGLLFDAAHAFGCSHEGRMIGNFGSAEVFSFHATKFLNSFEGGAIVTNDDRLADRARLMTNFGFTDYDSVVHLGINGKMTEVCAAMGLTSLESMRDVIEVNRRNHALYSDLLRGLPSVSVVQYDSGGDSNYQYVVIEIDSSAACISRDHVRDVLFAENVLARRYFYPGCHRMEPYRSYFPNSHLLLSQTERLVERVLVLPTGTATDPSAVASVCAILRLAITHGQEVTRALASRGRRPAAGAVP